MLVEKVGHPGSVVVNLGVGVRGLIIRKGVIISPKPPTADSAL